MKKRFIVLFLFMLPGIGAWAEKKQTHHKTHVHGQGTLNVAVESTMVFLELELPAMDVLGFEHPPRNQKEHQQLDSAKKLLQSPKQLFILPSNATCALKESHVESALLEHDEHKHEHEHHDEHEDESAHTDFHLTATFECQQVQNANFIDVALFQVFPRLQHVQAQILLKNKQLQQKLNSKNTRVNLK